MTREIAPVIRNSVALAACIGLLAACGPTDPAPESSDAPTVSSSTPTSTKTPTAHPDTSPTPLSTPTTPESQTTLIIALLGQKVRLDTASMTKLADGVDKPLQQGKKTPGSSLTAINTVYGSELGLKTNFDPETADKTLIASGKFTEVTSYISKRNLSYLPSGLISINTGVDKGFRLTVSLDRTKYPRQNGHSSLANGLGILDIQTYIDSKSLAHVLAPVAAASSPTPTPHPSSSATRSPSAAPSHAATPLPKPPVAAQVVSHGSLKKPEIALTFDADMTPDMLLGLQDHSATNWYNKKVIDTLHTNKVPATLFLSGLWAKNYAPVAKSLAADPQFEIGSQSQRYYAFTNNCEQLPSIPDSVDATEIDAAQKTIKIATGVTPKLFRFPELCYDETDLFQAGARSLTVVNGSASGDARTNDVNKIVAQTTKATKNGSIIIMHLQGAGGSKTANSASTADALAKLIPTLKKKYKFVKVSQLIADSK
jgi:peptidoglycan/xylan/chitin deacetylase (PgdA/CDA1 family)